MSLHSSVTLIEFVQLSTLFPDFNDTDIAHEDRNLDDRS